MDALGVKPEQRRELWQRIRSGASTDAAAVQELVKHPVTQAASAEEYFLDGTTLLDLLLSSEDLRQIVLPGLEAEDYDNLPTAPIFRALVDFHSKGKEISYHSLSEVLSNDASTTPILQRLIATPKIKSFEEALASVTSCLDALRLMKVERRINDLYMETAQAEREGDTEKRDRLARERLEMDRKRNALLHRSEGQKSSFAARGETK